MSKVLAKGRIGVDAAKAMDKLRDHLLADPSTWLAEIVRVATLSHATHVDITYDTDDLYVRFDGDPWKSGVIEHAAAALGTSGAAGDRRGYLLAVSSFAALGTGAKRVSVITRTEEGGLESSVLSSSGLGQKVRGDAVQAKDKRPVQSLCLHVEHGFTGIRVGRLVRTSRPAEVDALCARLEGGAPAITVNGSPLAPAHEPALLSVPIHEEDGLVIEVTPSWRTAPQMVFVELGVVLSSAPWRPETPVGRVHGGVALPLRAVVRRDRLVTNVSRSRVEEELERRVALAIEIALPALIDELKKRAAARDDPSRARCEDALGAMGVVAAIAHDTGHAGDPAVRALEPVLGLPLLWDAVGRLRSLNGARRIVGSAKPVFLREAPEPLPADHLPLTHDVFWLRGGTAEAYLRAVENRPYRAIAKDVTRGVSLRNERLAGPADPLEVTALPDHVIVHRAEEGALRALLALRAPGRMGSGCTVRLHVDGRLCETISLAEPPSGIPFDAALEWPEVLHPNRTYDSVVRDEGLARAIRSLGRLARQGVLAHLAGVPAHRSAEVRALVAGGAAGEGGAELRALAVWPALGRPPLSTLAVANLCQADGGVRSITPEEHDPTKPGATPGPVLILDDADRRALRTLLGGDMRIVPYASYLARSRTPPEGLEAALAAELGGAEAPWVHFEGEGRRFAATPADKDVIVMMHRGETVARIETPAGFGLAVAFDDEGLLPGGRTTPPADFTLGQQVSRVLHGFVKRPDAEAWARRSEAVRRLIRKEARKWPAPSTLHRSLRELPLFSLIEDGELAGHCSASTIAGFWASEVPRVEALPEPRVEGLKAILADEADAGVMTHLSGRPAGLAGTLVVRLRKRMARRAARAALLAMNLRDPAAPPPGAHAELPLVPLRPRPGVRRAVVAVLADEAAERKPQVSFLFEGREVGSLGAEVEGLPIALLVDFDRMGLLPGEGGPSPRWVRGLALMSRCAGHELALRLLRDGKPSPLLYPNALEVLKHAALDGGREAIREALENTSAVVPTIQGELAPLSLLIKGSTIRFGLEARADWPRAQPASPLDQPILLAPKDRRGDAIRALLGALGRPMRDVTEAVKDLLADRASGATAIEPVEPPLDERLRIRLGQRTAPGLGGYVDIIDGAPQLVVTQPGSPPWTPPPQAIGLLPCAVRGTVRAPRGRFSDAIMGDLAVALGRHLRDLAGDHESLPPFVARDIRRHLVDELGKKRQISKRVRAAKLFPTKGGAMASLEEIEKAPFSADLPLMELVPLLRALGKQVDVEVGMSADERRDALITATVNSIGEGDVGIARGAAGLSISHLGIKIGTIPRLLGFPATGRAQVPVLTRAEIESGALDPIRLDAIAAAAEDALVAAIDRFTAPASHVLARRFVDRLGERAKVVGWLWIPDGAVEAPFVITPSGSTRLAVESRGAPLPVPLGGYVFVADAPEDPAMRSAFSDVAWGVLESLVSEVPGALADELAPYLKLLRPRTPDEPALISQLCDMVGRGQMVSLVPGVRELLTRPEEVVVGADHPLGRALTRWAPKHVRWLSDAPAPAVPRPAAGAKPPAPAAAQATPQPAPPAPEPEPAVPDLGAPEPRLIDRFLTLFGVRPTWNAPKTHPLVRKLERVISRLPLRDGTVIAFSRGGRPVRFADGRVVIDPENPTIVALATEGDVSSLAAAILSEANRELSTLTDAEERRALLALLLES